MPRATLAEVQITVTQSSQGNVGPKKVIKELSDFFNSLLSFFFLNFYIHFALHIIMSTENTKADTPAVDNTATTTTTTEQVAESPVAATADATPDAPTTTTSDEAKDGEDTTGAATAAEDTTEEAASAAVKSEEAKEEPTKPTPSPSRSGTKRLSMFLSKAKKSLVPEKDEKKSTSHPATTSAETKALPEDPKPVTKEESQEQDAPAADETTEPAPASEAEPVASTSDDKQEKRKSKFLNGFFKKVRKHQTTWKKGSEKRGGGSGKTKTFMWNIGSFWTHFLKF